MHTPPSCALVPTFVGSTNYTCLSFYELVYFLSIANATALYLSVERYTVEPHIEADWPHKWAVVTMGLGDGTPVSTGLMAYVVWHSAIFS